MRKRLILQILFGVACFLIGLLLVVVIDYDLTLDAPMIEHGERYLVIPEKTGVGAIISLMEEGNLTQNPTYVRAYLWNNDLSTHLKPGTYLITPETTLAGLLQDIAEKKTQSLPKLLIPEGKNLYDVAAKLEALHITSETAFISNAYDPELTAELNIPGDTFEGYLFPATYQFSADTSPEEVIRRMHRSFKQVWSKTLKENPEGLRRLREDFKLNDHQILTLASLVEKEAAVASERAVIARVFLNRLTIGMKLQTDPTCVYPPLHLGEIPTHKRCHDPESRYSTYVIDGLPPGPISGVGRATIEAVLNPYNGPGAADHLYFVAMRDGSRKHYFSQDVREHQQAVDFFLKKEDVPPPNATLQP